MGNENPIAFITGASSGIGAAAVRLFASKGYDVVLTARRKERLEKLAEEVGKDYSNVSLLPVGCDVNDDESVKAAMAETEDRFGKINVLVNNAGYGTYGTLEQLGLEPFRANMETNYFGVIRCTLGALPLLREGVKANNRKKWGSAVVMVSSFVGRRALPAMGAYCASKFALEAFSESLRTELIDDRISVSVVNPGVTQTEFFDEAKGQRPKGYLHPKTGMSAEAVAKVIYSAVKRPFRNKYLTIPGKAGIFTNWAAPRLLDFIAAKVWKGKDE